MVANRLRVRLAEANMSAAALSQRMPDAINKVCMSFIQAGKVLPTKDAMKVMCEVLKCEPTDIYAATDIDLLSLVREQADAKAAEVKFHPRAKAVTLDGKAAAPIYESNGHAGEKQFRVWMPTEEKAALFKAINGLGYVSVAEWFREMCRKTLKEYIALNLQDKTLHGAITSTTQNQTL